MRKNAGGFAFRKQTVFEKNYYVEKWVNETYFMGVFVCPFEIVMEKLAL